jgi:hypothetical protein
MTFEKRAHVRYTPVEPAYAALGKDFSRTGRIRDISRGGLCFEYIVGAARSEDDTKLAVFLIDDSFHIHNLPCRVIYDHSRSEVRGGSIGIIEERVCGVKFLMPSSEQEQQIAQFLSSCVAR